jgi:Putative polyhydroxyalkanoic acid system protein (PHA_gran_rgn)
MQIEQPHDLGEKKAISRIDRFLDDLMQRQPPGGVTIKNARKDWDGNRMNFSFAAGKGLFSTTISGVMEVMADRVVLTSKVPALVRGVVGEDRIREVIERELARILSNGRR